MNASLEIRALATVGEQLLGTIPTGDPDVLEDSFAEYGARFEQVQKLLSGRKPTPIEQRELARVAQVHAAIEQAVAQRHRATGEILQRLGTSKKISGYAPVQASARGPRAVDASA